MPGTGTYDVEVREDQVMRTRDGTALWADVYRPLGDGLYPVLVHRTPYNKRGGAPYPNMQREDNEARFFASHGFIVVVQDTRGRFASEGGFVPFVHEAEDGFDTIEWAANLPDSSGDVGMFGQSYDAMCQYLAAALDPPHLRTAVPVSAPISYFDHCVYTSGAFNLAWMLHYVMVNLVLRGPDVDKALPQLRDFLEFPDDPAKRRVHPDAFHHRPLSDWADRLAEFAPFFRDYLEHETDDAFWKALEWTDEPPRIPMLHVSSWYDGFHRGTLRAFQEAGAGSGAGSGQRLIMGPWAHTVYTNVSSGRAGDLDFGDGATIDLHGIELDWFKQHLQGVEGEGSQPPVRLFVMGQNMWRNEGEWPLARTMYTPLYLSGGSGRERRLIWEPPGDETPDEFWYDPDDPTPTVGGHHLGVFGVPNGPIDQRPIEDRDDVLVYVGEVFATPVELTGPVTMTLHASTSAVDTDFVVKLVDVHPSGFAQCISDGIVRGQLYNCLSDQQPLEPGRVHAFTVEMFAVSHVVAAGHHLRVYVTSSDFPQWAANMNTGEPLGDRIETVVAHQHVYHDTSRPSHITLPVAPVARG